MGAQVLEDLVFAEPPVQHLPKPRSGSRLPLFPLQAVLFPGGLLSLKVFEARYLDLVGDCLRRDAGFGVVAIRRGREVRQPGQPPELEAVGCEARILDVDAGEGGILKLRCRGTRRFLVDADYEEANGLRVADVTWISPDPEEMPKVSMADTINALADAIASMRSSGRSPFLEPFDYSSVAWVANRWCELLPISITARQQLMAMTDPLARLELVDEFLRSKGVLKPGNPG